MSYDRKQKTKQKHKHLDDDRIDRRIKHKKNIKQSKRKNDSK